MNSPQRRAIAWVFILAGVLVAAAVITEYPQERNRTPDIILVVIAIVLVAIGSVLARRQTK